jgi:ABC-2 type transport system permease protein
MTTSTATAQPAARGRVVSEWSIGRRIGAHAMADRTTVVGALAFYTLAIGVVVGALWPPLRATFARITDSLPAALDQVLGNVSMATPAGWVNAEMMSIMGPGFLIATAVISGAAAIAGEEQARTMSLLLSTSASRTTFLAAKTAAMVVHVLIVAVAMFAGLLVGNHVGDMRIPVGHLVAATVSTTLLGLVFGAIALTLGAAGLDRRQAMAASAGIAALSFALAVFLPLDRSLTWLAKLSCWYPYSANIAVVNGIDWGFAAILVACAAAISGLGFFLFPRRDLRG